MRTAIGKSCVERLTRPRMPVSCVWDVCSNAIEGIGHEDHVRSGLRGCGGERRGPVGGQAPPWNQTRWVAAGADPGPARQIFGGHQQGPRRLGPRVGVEMTSLADQIRSCEYLYLGSLTEPSIHALRIVVLEAKAGPPVAESQVTETDPMLRSLLIGSRDIDHFPGCRRFELVWKSYIGYCVLNEGFVDGKPESSATVGSWSLFAEYTRSRYLDYLADASFASKDYPGPYRHWALYCQNHTIYIASQVEPVIREIGPA